MIYEDNIIIARLSTTRFVRLDSYYAYSCAVLQACHCTTRSSCRTSLAIARICDCTPILPSCHA